MSNFETILYHVNQRVATISLNLPKTMNAMSQMMRLELLSAIELAEADDDVRVMVISAQGRGFSSGTDLSEGLAGFATIEEQILQEYKPVLMGIDQSSKLTISAVHGACAGISTAVAMACDFTVMSESGFLFLPFANIGLVPDGGASYQLVKALGYKRALQLFVEGGRLTSNECLHYGLANKVVADELLVSEVQAWAATLAQGAPIAQRLGKQCFKAALSASLDETIDLEARHQVTASQSEDSLNAISAFFNKEKAVFTGR